MSNNLLVGDRLAVEQRVTRRALFQVAGVTLVGTVFLGSTGCASAVGAMGAPRMPIPDLSRHKQWLACRSARWAAAQSPFSSHRPEISIPWSIR